MNFWIILLPVKKVTKIQLSINKLLTNNPLNLPLENRLASPGSISHGHQPFQSRDGLTRASIKSPLPTAAANMISWHRVYERHLSLSTVEWIWRAQTASRKSIIQWAWADCTAAALMSSWAGCPDDDLWGRTMLLKFGNQQAVLELDRRRSGGEI